MLQPKGSLKRLKMRKCARRSYVRRIGHFVGVLERDPITINVDSNGNYEILVEKGRRPTKKRWEEIRKAIPKLSE